jgi:beta-phosphoglucomutase-like phosphatase (HAD superfamily)
MTTEAILFDIDGALMDRNDQCVLAWEEALLSFGASLTE